MSDKEECKRKRRTEHGDKEEGKREDINFQIRFFLAWFVLAKSYSPARLRLFTSKLCQGLSSAFFFPFLFLKFCLGLLVIYPEKCRLNQQDFGQASSPV